PDATALLLINLVEGRDHLFRYDVASGAEAPLEHDEGTIFTAKVRPDGAVWYRLSQGAHQPRVMEVGGGEVLRADGERAPDGRPYVSWRFGNGLGDSVRGFYLVADGDGPFRAIMSVRVGATWLVTARCSPGVQYYVDAGFV